MTPPQLATDTPVLNVLQPVKVGFFPAIGTKHDFSLCNHPRRSLNLWIFQKPLHRNPGFYWHPCTLGKPDVIFIILHLFEKAQLLQLGRREVPYLKTVQPVKIRARGTIDTTVRIEHIDNLKIVTKSYLEVRLIVSRSHLEDSRPELYVNVLIGYYWNFRCGKGPTHSLAD